MGVSRERNERNSSFSLRSTEIGWSKSVELRFKVHLLDEGYAWVPTTLNFVEDFVFGEEKLMREALPSLSKIYGDRRLGFCRAKGNAWTPKSRIFVKVRAEVREYHGSRVFRTPKSFVFTPRGREPSYSGLFLI